MRIITKVGVIFVLTIGFTMGKTCATAQETARKPSGQADWISLFDGETLNGWVDLHEPGADEIKVVDGTIRLGMGAMATAIRYDDPQKTFPKTNYEIEYTAKRTLGSDFFAALTFPVGDSCCTFVNGGWGGTVTGLSSIDGMDASENNTSSCQIYKDKTWYQFRVRVTPKAITVWIDDKQVIDCDIEDHLVSTRFEMDRCKPLGFASWVCEGRIKDIRYRRLPESGLNPKLLESQELNGRQTERFEHGTLPEWGAKNPNQTDIFYVAHPLTGPAEGRPLYVVLHSAGDDATLAVKSAGLEIIYNPPADFYALFCDCYANRETDWWWGGRNANQPEITPEIADRATAELMPVEKRVLAEIAWVVETYKIDPNRIYLCGNSMGASGTLGIGMRNGDVFAAIKANVPAGIWHAFDRLQLAESTVPAGFKIPDPPVCLDYSAPNDDWSLGHEALFAAVEARKYSYIAYWGNFGHESRDSNVMKVNDLFKTFDWTEIRKNAAYPVFTKASTDDKIPWPERAADAPAGQRGAYFRWNNLVDTESAFEMELRLATADELKSTLFQIPVRSTADVTLRRLQKFQIAPNQLIQWQFGDKSGETQADENGLLTIPQLTITDIPTVLILAPGI